MRDARDNKELVRALAPLSDGWCASQVIRHPYARGQPLCVFGWLIVFGPVSITS